MKQYLVLLVALCRQENREHGAEAFHEASKSGAAPATVDGELPVAKATGTLGFWEGETESA